MISYGFYRPALRFILATALTLPVPARAWDKDRKLTETVSEQVIATVPRHFFQQGPTVLDTGVISPDGKQIAWVEKKGGLRVVVNNNVGPPYDDLAIGSFIFSQDGKRFAYKALKEDRSLSVIDGKEGKSYSAVSIVSFSQDGKHAGYMAKEGTKYFCVIDDQAQALDAEPVSGIVFSPSGYGLTYVISNNGEQVVDKGRKHKSYDFIESGSLIMSQDGNRTGYIAARGGKRIPPPKFGPPVFAMHLRKFDKARRMVVVDEQEGPEYEFAYGLTFSPDGKRYSYAAYRGDDVFVVTDGTEGQTHRYEYNRAMTGIREPPVFSPDSKRIAYVIGRKTDERFVIVDGKEEGPYRGIGPGTLTFSHDSKRVAYAVQIGRKYFLVLDGVVSKESFPDTEYRTRPVFSDDDAHIVYGSPYLIIDGKFDGKTAADGRLVVGGTRFVGPTQFQYVEFRPWDKQVRVVEKIILPDSSKTR